MQSSVINNSHWGALIELLQTTRNHHAPDSKLYQYFSKIVPEMAKQTFGEGQIQQAIFSDVGKLEMPFFSMGAINSTHLFGLDELIIFSYYLCSKKRYVNVADIGANIGLHSIFMAKCGWNVTSFEPDPIHVKRLLDNVHRNGVSEQILVHEKAVSSKGGELEFIRVKGNTTGSHLAGAKDNPYGEIEKFTVEVCGIDKIIGIFDLIKLDIEGEEAAVISATKKEQWSKTDAIIEVGSAQNAQIIFDHLKQLGVGMFPQRLNWQPATEAEQLPISYKQGSLFISSRNQMNWVV